MEGLVLGKCRSPQVTRAISHWGPVRLWQGGVAPGSFQAIGANLGCWKERAPGEGASCVLPDIGSCHLCMGLPLSHMMTNVT